MKKVQLTFMYLLLIFIWAGCSEDKDLEIDSKKSETVTNQDSIASLYKVIIGEWKLIKSIPEGNTLKGINHFSFYSDSSYVIHFVPEARTYQGKYEIIKRDDWKLGTIDYKYLPTKYWLRLFQSADFYEDFPFVIESHKMHINLGGFTYIYTAFMFERVK